MLVIGRRTFKSQDEAIDYTRGILRKYGMNGVIQSGEDFEYMQALIQRHPRCHEKTGCGIKAFKIVRNFGGHLAVDVVRQDGTQADFSFLRCVRKKSQSSQDKLHGALRAAIHMQTAAFKEYKAKEFKALVPGADGANEFQCEACKKRIIRSIDAQVDHVIEFHVIRDGFLAGRTDIPSSFQESYHGPHKFMQCDHNFVREWQHYHGEKSVFRILCPECNSKRLTKDFMSKAIRSLK